MTDRNRNRDDEQLNDQQHGEQTRREAPETADDRGIDRDRRSFSGDREQDDLGSEMEDDTALDESDDMDMDDGLGGPGRDNR
jgi:hypothetical protein